jgi:branched-chain amino acid transport system permease protein
MAYFIQQVINGLTLGTIYALVAIGYTMVYGIIRMINFAHGDVYMMGAFIALIAFVGVTSGTGMGIGGGLAVALVVTVVFTGLWGWAIERVAYRPLRGAPKLAPLISAIGMSIVLENFVQLAQGARVKSLPPFWSGGLEIMHDQTLTVTITWLQIGIIVVTTLLMTGLTLLLNRTPFGRAQRACEQDPKMASLLGIHVDRVISATFVIGAVLAAIAGLMVTLYYGVIDFYIGFLAGIKAFTAAVLGGIGSLPGALLGGLLIGLIEALWSAYFSIEYKDVAAFSILVLVLLFRPTGILGRSEVEKI